MTCNVLYSHKSHTPMQRNLCDRIIKLDRNIRFVGIVNNRGEVIEGGVQQGVLRAAEHTVAVALHPGDAC